MRVVRLGTEPSAIGASVRAALAAWGAGDAVLGGVALCGVRPPDGPRELDAVLVLPRGIVVVLGVDLPGPAMQLEAPGQLPWTADGAAVPRGRGINPAQDALESAAALARRLQARVSEPLPVSAVVAVGPYVGGIVSADQDGVRVLHPSTTSVLAAVRELATGERACAVDPARKLLEAIDPRVPRLSVRQLTGEGFPDSVAPEMAAASTMLLPKITEESPPARPRRRVLRRGRVIAIAAALLVALAAALALLLGGGSEQAEGAAAQRVDGAGFTRAGAVRDSDCAEASTGLLRGWFEREPCTGLSRQVFTTTAGGRPAAVSVAVVELSAESGASGLRELAAEPGTGGPSPLAVEGVRWDGAAQAVQQDGSRVRIVRAARAAGASTPDDLLLRVLAERGLQLDVG